MSAAASCRGCVDNVNTDTVCNFKYATGLNIMKIVRPPTAAAAAAAANLHIHR